MIYAYTTPEIARHNGWVKIGYTEKKVEARIKQQTQTADVAWQLEWKGNALFDDGSWECFTDKDFHSYLRKCNVEQEKGKNNEWFKITPVDSENKFYDFRRNRGVLLSSLAVIPYTLRREQEEAVSKTLKFCEANKGGEFLWNAKPRFGKTLATYDFAKRLGAKTVLIVTNRPAIANSWFSDYEKFLGTESGYYFVSEVDYLLDKAGVLTREEFANLPSTGDKKCIEFVSLQDLKGGVYFGGKIDKLAELKDTNWDLLVIDEAHEGIDTFKTDIAFDKITRGFTLHLSGTPFKALANEKFAEDAIFNWTYADEQQAKRDWQANCNKEDDLFEENPYANLPRLNLYTYLMSDILEDELSQGIEIDGKTREYAFDLNEFFAINGNGNFVYETSVDKFLNALTKQEKFPFSTPELRDELKHTFWLLNRVDSAKALKRKLQNHPVFREYEIVLAAGDGRLDEEDEIINSFDKVREAIAKCEKTITISVGQLTTGVTIPEWSGVLMLSNLKSPALYMQAAFRAQNPCLFRTRKGFSRKKNAYVFDFDPARTLTIFEQFANDLYSNVAGGKGGSDERKENVRRLLNFFPVIGEDDKGELIELDAERLLLIPRKIRSLEVVRRGFMSNFLFQNIANVFGAPKEIIDLINKFEPLKEPTLRELNITDEVKDNLSLDKDGNVALTQEYVIGQTKDIFGDKIFEVGKEFEKQVARVEATPKDKKVEELKKIFKKAEKEILEATKEHYGDELRKNDINKINSKLNHEAERKAEKLVGDHEIAKNVIEHERQDALQNALFLDRTIEEINEEYDRKSQEVDDNFKKNIENSCREFVEESTQTAVEIAEFEKRQKEKDEIEATVRDHLRGFSRTIPSFLMAYGNENITLANFDTIIPDDVFKEVTSISLDEFRKLRDGYDYLDRDGEKKHYSGHVFDSVVFDDSVREFMQLKKKLANYFDEESKEDIFDFVPPQKTNQIFTPKKIVIKMVDMLEGENPGCFDEPDKTFVDLYMKSGLYIAEIVKRLYRSEKMKSIFPNEKQRLKHIFEHQVFGLAPTEIIYRIATNFILGFDEEQEITKHNFKKCDALKFAKTGTLEKELDKLFGK